MELQRHFSGEACRGNDEVQMTNDEKEQSVVPLATPKPWRRPGYSACHAVVPRLRDEGGWSVVPAKAQGAFTLLELLIVISIIAILMVLLAPAFTSLKSADDVTSAAYTIKGVLDSARTYAKANNTYTWVGFFEEDVSSTTPGTQGIGRLVVSIVASKDGTMLYTPPLTSVVTLPSANLIQVGKLTKIENAHLKTFLDPTEATPPDTFDTRPTPGSPPNDLTARIGNDAIDLGTAVAPASPSLLFPYPLGGTQYSFAKIIQFSPRGEAVIDNSNYTIAPIAEVGLEPTHGTTVPVSIPANVVAVQITGLGGSVKIYRR